LAYRNDPVDGQIQATALAGLRQIAGAYA
jgi:hypothetical protein